MKIFLDAGHNTVGSGATDNRMDEAAYNWFLAQLFCSQFTLAETMISRGETEKITFEERAKRAKDFKADLVISIHCNTNPDPQVKGMMTFYRNRDGIGKEICETILRCAPVGLYKENRKSISVEDPTWQRCENVLEHYEMPAILIEVGFLSNKNDVEYLDSITTQIMICKSIEMGVLRLMQINEKI